MSRRVTRRQADQQTGKVFQKQPQATACRNDVDRLFDGFFPAAFGRSMQAPDPWIGHCAQDLAQSGPALAVTECAVTDRAEETQEEP